MNSAFNKLGASSPVACCGLYPHGWILVITQISIVCLHSECCSSCYIWIFLFEENFLVVFWNEDYTPLFRLLGNDKGWIQGLYAAISKIIANSGTPIPNITFPSWRNCQKIWSRSFFLLICRIEDESIALI